MARGVKVPAVGGQGEPGRAPQLFGEGGAQGRERRRRGLWRCPVERQQALPFRDLSQKRERERREKN